MYMKKKQALWNSTKLSVHEHFFSLTQVKIIREEGSKADPTEIFSKQLLGPRRLRQLSVEWGIHSHCSLVATLGKESELKPHHHSNTNFYSFLFLIKPYMRTANKFHVSWLYRRKISTCASLANILQVYKLDRVFRVFLQDVSFLFIKKVGKWLI